MQLVADELDVPFNSVKFVQSDTWFTPDQGATAGSQSTGTENGPAGVRQAAAEARLALLTMASTKLGAPVSNLTVSNGVVSVVGNPSQSVSYASLLGGATFNLPITGKATPKPYTAYKIVGTSVPRVDIPAKVFGTFTYSQDLKVPGMLYARVVRPPTLDSKLVSVDGWPSGKPARRRPGRAEEQLRRGRREDGVGRDQGSRHAEGHVAGRAAAAVGDLQRRSADKAPRRTS